MSSDDEQEEGVVKKISSRHLRAYCKQKARRPEGEGNEGEGEGSEGEAETTSNNEFSSGDNGSISEASESADIGTSGFLDDEAMEVELSSEEWEEGSGESEESDEGEEGSEDGGFIVDEALDEEVYQAKKRQRRARFMSDTETNSESGLVPKRHCGTESKDTAPRTKERACSDDEDGEESAGGEDDSVIGDSDGQASSIPSPDNSAGVRNSPRSKKPAAAAPANEGGGVSSREGLQWKRDLSLKASTSYRHRHSSAANLRKLIYSEASLPGEEVDEEGEEDAEEIGGLFQLLKKKALTVFHKEDSSRLPNSALCRDWSDPGVAAAAKSVFVTGSWGAEGAQALLDEDDALYGDFEDMENAGEDERGRKKEVEEEAPREEDKEKKRLEKKKRLKVAFDVGYDDEGEGGGTYLDDLRKEVSEQEQRNKAEFEGMDEQARLQYEGVRPGYYVRLELKGKSKIDE